MTTDPCATGTEAIPGNTLPTYTSGPRAGCQHCITLVQRGGTQEGNLWKRPNDLQHWTVAKRNVGRDPLRPDRCCYSMSSDCKGNDLAVGVRAASVYGSRKETRRFDNCSPYWTSGDCHACGRELVSVSGETHIKRTKRAVTAQEGTTTTYDST